LRIADKGWFRYTGPGLVHVKSADTGTINDSRPIEGGLLLRSDKGLLRYDGAQIKRVEGEETDVIRLWGDVSGELLLGTSKGLFRYNGAQIKHIDWDTPAPIRSWHQVARDLLLDTPKGLFRYDGTRVAPIVGHVADEVLEWREVPGGILLLTESEQQVLPNQIVHPKKSLFLYDRIQVEPVEGELPEALHDGYNLQDGLLLGSEKGSFFRQSTLLYYDGTRVESVIGDKIGRLYDWRLTPEDLLLRGESGLFRVVYQPLSGSEIYLDNAPELQGASPSRPRIQTRWSMKHPCSDFADQFGLHVVATTTTGKESNVSTTSGFSARGKVMSFESAVPISDAGNWTFRVVSMMRGTSTDIGKPSDPVSFVAPVAHSTVGSLLSWWRVIAGSGVAALVVLNLVTFSAARYRAAAWRLATDDVWGKTVLAPQMLLLRHWQRAQLWLLDLYVRERRKALSDSPQPFLPLPLTGPNNAVADSDAVLERLASERHVWIQGGAGMGKTAIFEHLIQTHFGGTKATSFDIFRRNGYVLIPIEARRFPEATFDEKGASAWVVACVLSILSQRGLAFADRGLLRAMLDKGTLAVVIDGLNEVARGPSVAAFVTEFPATPSLVTSQESGEQPFETWCLPSSIVDHVDKLLKITSPQR
jgi:hypothetical protein